MKITYDKESMKRMLEEELVPAVIKHGDVLDKIGKARREKDESIRIL